MKRIVTIVLSCMMIAILSGCALFHSHSLPESSEKESYMLNERQKTILEKEGLPTEYDELSLSKKTAIEAIEDMFQYLDDRYPDEVFEYIGYIAQSPLESEQLIVASRYGKVTVQRDLSGENPVYKDDYIEAKAADIYAGVINDFLAEKFDEKDYIVTVMINKYDGELKDGIEILKSCGANTTVFVRENAGEEEFTDIVTSVSEFLNQNVGDNSVWGEFYLVEESEFTSDLPTRYVENIRMDIFLEKKNYYRRADGEEKLY